MAEEEDFEQPSGLRPFWSGTISFGLVTVPVALYSAIRTGGVALKMIGPDEAPVRRRYICSKDEKVLDADDIVRGYEIEKGKFVVVTDDELEAIEPRKSREIDLQLFVDRDEIAPIYYQRAYFLIPSGGTNKAYRLLAEVMEKKKADIVKAPVEARDEDEGGEAVDLLAVLSRSLGGSATSTKKRAPAKKAPAKKSAKKKTKASATDVKKLENQIAKKSRKLDPGELLDDYEERLEKLVAA